MVVRAYVLDNIAHIIVTRINTLTIHHIESILAFAMKTITVIHTKTIYIAKIFWRCLTVTSLTLIDNFAASSSVFCGLIAGITRAFVEIAEFSTGSMGATRISSALKLVAD